MASLKFRHYATESALKGNGTVQNALNAFDVGTIVFIDDTQKQYIITSKSNNVVTYKIYYGEAAVVGVSGTDAARILTFSDGSEIKVTINNVEHATSSDTANTAKSVAWNNVTGKPTNFVTTDDTQTITGAKTFTNNVSLQGSTSADSITTEDLIVNGAARFVSGLTGDLKGDVVGNVIGNVTGNVSGSSGSCTGNALTATTLQTARSINGTSFNGSQAITTAKWGTARTITIADNTNEHTQANNSIDGGANFTLKLPATIKADIIGNASTANSAKSVDWANVINKPNLVTTDTEQTITGAKTFNNNTTFKNETDVESLTADSLLVTGSARFTNTINGNLKGNVEGNLTGNAATATTAATATEFSTNKAVTLTGDVTGSASSKGGWSVATTIANGAVTNAKLANSKITIAGTAVSLGGSIAASTIGNALTSDAPAAYATNAGTATKASEADKATKDSDGNVINTTYLKRSGGTVTGALILNDATTVNSTLTANNITADNLTVNGAAKFNGGLEGNLKGDVDGNATTATTCTGNATTATTATNLASKPSGLFTAATSSADASLTITAGGKTSDAITIGKVKSAFTADNATTATSCSGNAETATTLQNTRKINGTDFNGSADITTSKWGTARNITISDGTNSGTATSVDGSGAITLNLPGTIKANLSGNAATATKATNADRATGDSDGNTINTTYLKRSGGVVTGNVTFNSSVAADSITAEDLIVNGASRFVSGITGDLVGNVTGNVTGNLSGNASSATKAINDGNGNTITSTYATKTERSNNDITAASLTTAKLTLTRAAGNITANIPTWNQDTTGTAAKATADAKGNNIVNTYATKAEVAALPKSMVIKGTLDATHALPTSGMTEGDTYIVGASGKYNKIACKVGDFFVRTSDGWLRVPAGDEWEYNENTIKGIKVNNAGHADTAGTATSAGVATNATNSDKVDEFHAMSAGSLLYKYEVTATIPASSVTGDFWYATITFERSYVRELTRSMLDAAYSNYQGQVYLNTYEYSGAWYAFTTAYNGSNIKGIAYKAQNNPIYYVKLAKPVMYNNNIPDGTITVYSPFNCTIEVSATAPSNVTFTNLTIPGFTNLKANSAVNADTATTALSCSGNADNATKDGSGNNIVNTYARIDKVYNDSSTYRQFLGKSGSSSDWVRTTESGIIPYTNGDASNGHSSLGTSSWYFSEAYIQNIYGYLNGNISGSSTSCSGNSATATDADTLDGYHASSLVKFYLSPMSSNAPADSAKSWFIDTMPSASSAIIYNVPGSEKTIIAGKSSGPYGHMLQLNYDDNYLRILRYYSGNWKTDDWEKISAGHADTATVATTATTAINDGNGNVITSTYLPLSGGTMTNPIKFSYNNNGNCNVSRTSGFSMFYSGQDDAVNQGFPIKYSSVISFMTGYCGMQLATYGGNDSRLFFRKISDSDVWTPWYTLLHSDNYNSYSPKLDGTGATGTWGINISGNANTATTSGACTGNAATATKATQDSDGNVINTTYLKRSGGTVTGNVTFNSSVTTDSLTTEDLIVNGAARFVSGLTGDLVGNVTGNLTGTASYATNAGTAASAGTATTSGACTGNAATASKLQTPRTIWGQSFDGSGNVSGSLTGVTNISASGVIFSNNYGANGNTAIAAFVFNKGGDYFGIGPSSGGIANVGFGTTSNTTGTWKSEMMTITSSGNVGIGTTSPTSKLHVAGTGYFASDVSSASNIIAGGYIKGETVKISSGCTLEYSSTDKCVRFVFN